MNYIRHLNAFFNCIRNDGRLASSHVSLYMAMFQYWNLNRFQNPFPVYRDEMMNLSKIGSKNTYHKCLKELHLAGYIIYHLSPSRYIPVKISLIRLDTNQEEKQYSQLDIFSTEIGTGQVPILTDTSTENGTAQVPKAVLLLKQVNTKLQNSVQKTHTGNYKKNGFSKKAVKGAGGVPKSVHTESNNESLETNGPALSEVEAFFQLNNCSLLEAQKFFYYNEGKAWMLNEKIPIKDWQSIGRKWMLGINSTGKGSNHSLNNDKNYSEPL